MDNNELSVFERVVKLETKVDRMIIDIEAETKSRTEINKYIFSDLKDIKDGQMGTNRIVWMAVGGVATLNAVLAILVVWLHK